MEFGLTEEQQELAGFVRELLDQRSSSEQVRRTLDSQEPYDADLWRVLTQEIGAASLAIPERWGGAGFSTRETHIVLEELGRHLTPSPFLGSIAFAAQALVLAGQEAVNEEVLPSIASGETTAALAWATPQGQWDPSAVSVQASTGEEALLTGSVPLVLGGSHASVLVVIARSDDGPALYLVRDSAEASWEDTPALDPTLQFASLTLQDTAAIRLTRPDDSRILESLYAHMLTSLTATQVGTMNLALEMTVDYSKQRVQFGRPIGSFQALKHRMADMHVLRETATTMSHAAAWAQSVDSNDHSRLAAMAKATCSDSLTQIAAETIQIHGGIAITWEHDAHIIFKRAHATAQLCGTARTQRLYLERSLGLTPQV